jgi:hypothetical protein
VVEHRDPKQEPKLPQHDDPEDHCERETRLLDMTMAVDPMLLATVTIKRFPCPSCGADVEVRLPAKGNQGAQRQLLGVQGTAHRRLGNGPWELIQIAGKDPTGSPSSWASRTSWSQTTHSPCGARCR